MKSVPHKVFRKGYGMSPSERKLTDPLTRKISYLPIHELRKDL
jgi:hypothetical protein